MVKAFEPYGDFDVTKGGKTKMSKKKMKVMPNKMKKDRMLDVSGLNMAGKKAEMQINSGVKEAEMELENLSFVKKTGRKDRSKDDPFAKIGL